MLRGLQIPVSVGHMSSAPRQRHRHHQEPEIREMVPMKVPVQGALDIFGC